MALGLTAALAATIAVADDAVPATLDLQALGSITVTKYAQPDSAGIDPDGTELDPLPGNDLLDGVEFTVRTVSIDLSTADGWAVVAALDPYAGTDMATVGSAAYGLSDPVTRVTGTDGAGVATFGGLPVGVYLVEETGVGPYPLSNRAAPFYVTVPLPQAGGGWLYDVVVYPRNAVTAVGKSVDESAALALGSTVSWPVRVNASPLTAGAGLARLTVTDVLDSRLGFDGVTVTPASLVAETHYTVSQSAGADSSVTVVVDFTAAGRAALEAQQGEEVVVTVHTTVNSIGDGTIGNRAVVAVNDDESATNTVHSVWGALKVFSHATDGTLERPLQGAEFQVFTTGADAVAGSNPISVVIDGQPVDTFVPGADGTVVIPGLLVGTSGDREYWLRETKPAAGYLPLAGDENPISVMVTAGSIDEAVVASVESVRVPTVLLPRTGVTR